MKNNFNFYITNVKLRKRYVSNKKLRFAFHTTGQTGVILGVMAISTKFKLQLFNPDNFS